MPFAIFLLHNYMSSLPKDIFESARIDGANHFRIFWRLVLPLSVPVLAAFAIFQFLWTWNDYLIAVTMIGANQAVAPSTVVIALRHCGSILSNTVSTLPSPRSTLAAFG